MFDRIAGVLRPHELGHDGRAAPSLARARRRPRGARRPATARSTSPPAPATWPSSSRAAWAPAARSSARTSPRRCSSAPASRRAGGRGISWEWGNALELPYASGRFDAATVGFGARNFSDLDRGLAEMARVVRPGGRVVVLEITTPRRPPLSTFYSVWFDRIVPLIGAPHRRGGGLHLPAELGAGASRARRGSPRAMERAGLGDIRWILTAGGIIALHVGTQALDGRDGTGHRGHAGRRLAHPRPARARRAAARRGGRRPRRAAGRARRLDDRRRRQAPAPAAGLPGRRRARRARGSCAPPPRSSSSTRRRSSTTTCSTPPRCAAACRPWSRPPGAAPRPPPATCSSRARSPSSPPTAAPTRSRCSPTRPRRWPRASCCSAPTPGTPTVSLERYLRRCELKTARLFEAACRLGALEAGGAPEELGAFGRRIGLAFQLLDDVLDVSGPAERTGKQRGTDLLDGTVTLPFILARERDAGLAALDPRSIDSAAVAEDVCDRIAATGALDEARARALEMVNEAKAGLPAGPVGAPAPRARARRHGRRGALRVGSGRPRIGRGRAPGTRRARAWHAVSRERRRSHEL